LAPFEFYHFRNAIDQIGPFSNLGSDDALSGCPLVDRFYQCLINAHDLLYCLQRGATGSGEEISQINALVFAKDFGSGVSPVDIKPVTEVNAAPRSAEQAAAPALEARSTVGVNTQQGASRPACSIHSCVSSLEGEKENATALTAQPLAVGVQSLQQAIPLPYALPIVPSKVHNT